MAAFFRHPLIRTLPVGGAAALAFLLFVAVAAMPGAWLRAMVGGLVAPDVAFGAATRLTLALAAGVVGGALAWAALYLLFGPGGPFARTYAAAHAGGVQTVRRADRHPDAPPRRPLSAAHELAAPPAPIVPVQPLPADLEMPLAAFDPHSILPVPREAVRPVSPLVPALAPGERLDTFALTPASRPAPPAPESDEPPSIDALLRRLEAGAERRGGQGR